jgi:hypothetical protein
MKITRMAILCLITVVLSFAPVLAQDHKEGEEHEELPQVEVVGGYSLLRSEGENLNGWKAAVSFNLNKWLAVAVDADGHYYSENSPEGRIKESEHSLTAGPHFALRNKSKLVPFAYVLGGVAWERRSLNGIGETESGFAFEPGGGLDWEVSKRFSVRIFDVSASVTRIGGHTSTKPKFAAGIVLKFGKK